MTAIGNGLNAISPNFTMFPIEFPTQVIETYSNPGDMVLDPFCGRGTTNFASRLLGRRTYGIDCNPMAVAVSRAKMVAPKVEAIVTEAKEIIKKNRKSGKKPKGEFWSTAFDEDVLMQLTTIRDELLKSCRSSERIALRAIMIGALHGPVNKGKPSYFSNQCPRTYAPKPAYAVRFWREHGLTAPKVDLIDVIEERAKRYYGNRIDSVEYTIIKGDCRNKSPFMRLDSLGGADLIVTSPPYPGMVTYATDQWLRNWFVGGHSNVDYYSNNGIKSLRSSDFINDLRSAWVRVAEYSKTTASLICRFGVLPSYKGDKYDMILRSFEDTPWKVQSIHPAGKAKKGKRIAETFMGDDASTPNEEIDVFCTKQSPSMYSPPLVPSKSRRCEGSRSKCRGHLKK